MKTRLMDFNIRFSVADTNLNAKGEIVDSTMERRVPLIANMIRSEQIDVVGVQEAKECVHHGRTKITHFEWKTRLCAALPEYGCTGAQTKAHAEGGYIFYRTSKYEKIDSGHFYLARAAGSEDASLEVLETPNNNGVDRVCAWVMLRERESGQHLLFFDTHLSDAASPIVEYQSDVIVTEIPKIIARMEKIHGVADCPVVLVGDMNAKSDSGTYRNFTSLLRDSLLIAEKTDLTEADCSAPNYTLLAEDESYPKGKRIDYIFVSDAVNVLSYEMIYTATNRCKYGEFLSDHNALVIDAEIG